MRLPRYSQLKFGLVLGIGALIAIVLCTQCVRTFFFIGSVLVPREAREEAQRSAGALGMAARSAGISDGRKLAPVLQHVAESAGGRVLWMRVIDADNHVLSGIGSAPATASHLPSQWWDRLQKHEDLAAVVNTKEGKALSVLLPLHVPPPRWSDPGAHHPVYLLATGISLDAVARGFVDLREHLITGMIAALSLLVAIAVIAMRARQYLRGRYLDAELQLGRRVQNDLRPQAQSLLPHIEFGASALAVDHVGGDFYDIFEWGSGKIGLVLGDVSGKGVPAALLVSVLQGAIRSSTAPRHELACEQINRMLCERTANERFATLFWAVFDAGSGSLRYVNAGHGAPMLIRAGSHDIERLTEGGPVLGCLPNARYSAGEIQIKKEDTLVLYTDGISEATDKSGEEFGDERVLQILADTKGGFTPSRLCQKIENEVTAFAGPRAQLNDDRTLLVVRFLRDQTAVNKDDEGRGEGKLSEVVARVA